MLLEAFLKMADQGQNCMPFGIHARGVAALEEEWFAQGDQERALGMPITGSHDRSKDTLSMLQPGFLGKLVRPILEPYRFLISQQFGEQLIQDIDANKTRWEGIVKKHGTDTTVQGLLPLLLKEWNKEQQQKKDMAVTPIVEERSG